MDWIKYIRSWLVWLHELVGIVLNAFDALVRHFEAAKGLIAQTA